VIRVVDVVVPRRLGTSFRWLLGSSWASNLGDGILVAAGPLLVASQTRDPLLVALAALLQRLPWLVFGLYAGVLADRLDRRRIVIVADASRVVVIAGLVACLVTGEASIGVVLMVLFLLGVAETFADTASQTLLPMLVQPRDLGTANARLNGGFIVVNQLAGPPIGAALFAAGMAVPFLVQALCVAAGVLLVARVRLPSRGRRAVQRGRALADIRQGWHWLWHHPPVRTLAITIFTFNVTFGAAWSVLVLYSQERLGMGSIGFGAITTASALGGLVGTASYGWLERHVSLGNIMRGGLVIETLTHLVLAVTTTPWVAMPVFFVFGAHAFVWGTTSTAVRQRAVPTEFQGRVGAVYMTAVVGGLVLGAAVGGVVARTGGLTAPFWFGFVGSALILAFIWKSLVQIVHMEPAAAPA
jgi:MFS family permease